MGKTKLFLKECLSDWQLLTPILTALILNAVIWGISVWRATLSSSWLVLHYNVYFGIDWIGQGFKNFYYPILGLIIFMLNYFLALIAANQESRRWLLWIAALSQAIILLNIIIIIINYSN